MAYHDLNQREYELTKHVSLLQVDPAGAASTARYRDLHFHHARRSSSIWTGRGIISAASRSIALTIPCVAGPYTSVNCTLTLQKSTIRTSADPGKGYARQGSDDPRFNDYYGTVQSIVTSSAQSDSGLFETNMHDERYLPFEGAGVAGSQWQLTLPIRHPQFDFDTITDVVLHVRYTAREGGDPLRAAAIQNLHTQIKNHNTVGSACLYSIRHDFPTDWAKFQATSSLSINFTAELYPFWAQGRNVALTSVELFAEMSAATTTVTVKDFEGCIGYPCDESRDGRRAHWKPDQCPRRDHRQYPSSLVTHIRQRRDGGFVDGVYLAGLDVAGQRGMAYPNLRGSVAKSV